MRNVSDRDFPLSVLITNGIRMMRRWGKARYHGVMSVTMLALGGVYPIHSSAAQVSAPGQQVTSEAQTVPHVDANAARVVTITLHEVTLDSALAAIQAKTGISISYGSWVVPLDRRVSLDADKMPLLDALHKVLRGTGVKVKTTPTGKLELVPEKPAARAEAQGGGIVAGRVVDARSNAVIPNVTVVVKDAPKNVFPAATRADGRFYIYSLPAGTYVLTARRLGYLSQDQRVTVVDNDSVHVQFAMTAVPSVLQGVVTTGAGDRTKLEVGNAISSINADSIVQNTPIRNVSDLLKGRAAGVDVLTTGGTVGAGSRIRIRGESSLLTSEDPVVIVDGVRFDASFSRGTFPAANSSVPPSNNAVSPYGVPQSSRLNDIDPNSIESIEVLKGPAASALYGSDAANGVIVIKTKRGHAGPTRWALDGQAGRSTMDPTFADNYYGWGKQYSVIPYPGSCTLVDVAKGACVQDSVTHFNPLNHSATSPFQPGHNEQINGQVSGGTDRMQYFVGSTYDNEIGMLGFPPALEASTLKLLNGTPLPSWSKEPNVLNSTGLSSALTTQFGKGNISLTANAKRQYHRDVPQGAGGFVGFAVQSPGYLDTLTEGWGTLNPANNFLTRADDRVSHGYGALAGDWRPTAYLSGHATAGVDFSNVDAQVFLGQEYVLPGLGEGTQSQASRNQQTTLTKTLDANGTLDIPFTRALQLRSTLGAQYTGADYSSMATYGYDLPLGVTTYNSAASGSSSEFNGEQATAGWYLQETLNLNQRLFLTAAVRSDASSAFGSAASTVAYPKWNASWLISQEPFFPHVPAVSSLRLRMGYGNAGSQPPFDQRFRTYLYLPAYANSTVINAIGLSTVGNTDLLPEKSSEMEGGFDLGLGDDRVTFGVTLANKVTHNALVTRTLPPSFGAPSLTQMQNIGKIQNRNLEIEATAHPIETSLLDWSSSVTLSRGKNQVVTLGAAGPSPVQYGILNAQSRYVGGYPVDGLWAHAVTGFADVNGDGVLEPNEVQLSDSLVYAGRTSPAQNIGWQNSVSLWSGRLMVSANFTYEGGATQYNQLLASQCLNNSCVGAVDSHASLSDQLLAQSISLTGWPYLEQVSVFRFDELSFTFMAPPSLLRSIGASTASISLMGRNLGLWTHYRGADPDVNTAANQGGDNVGDSGGIPQPRQWFVRVRLGF